MSVLKLLSYFEDYPCARVELKDVQEKIIRISGDIKIQYYEFEKDLYPFIIGMMKQEEITLPYADDTTRVADIFTRKELPDKEYHLITCKELIHLLDPRIAQTKTPEDVLKLSEEICIPTLFEGLTDHGLRDRVAILLALAVLFPLTTRNYFLPKLKSEEITIAEISTLVNIPEIYVAIVMSPAWDLLHEKAIKKYLEGDREEEEEEEETLLKKKA